MQPVEQSTTFPVNLFKKPINFIYVAFIVVIIEAGITIETSDGKKYLILVNSFKIGLKKLLTF